MRYKWKTNLGSLHCDHLAPGDHMYFTCRTFDQQVAELRDKHAALKEERLKEVTKLNEDLLNLKIKYLELLKQTNKGNIL